MCHNTCCCFFTVIFGHANLSLLSLQICQLYTLKKKNWPCHAFMSCWLDISKANFNWDVLIPLFFHMLQDEIDFWRDLQKKYLEPLKENKEQQEKIADDLRELRNKVHKEIKYVSMQKVLFMWSCLKYLLWNSKDLFPCCFAFIFLTGYICLFLLQCTLAGGNFLPSGDWWLSLHKDPKNLSQWVLWPNRSVFRRSNRTDVSTGLRNITVNAVFWNVLPQVTKHAHNN